MENKKHFRLFFLFLLFYAHSFGLHAYDIPLPEDEAPASLFSISMDDEDVELYIKGTWDAVFTGSWGFGYSRDRGIYQDSSHVSIPTGFEVEQTPDLTLSLWLFDRYFLETSFADNWESSTYLMGYQGRDDEFLQLVRIGNTDVSMGEYGYWTVPEVPENGLGISGAFKTENSFHEILLRFDPAENRSVTFIGKNRLDEEEINPGNYTKNRRFILPSRPVEGLQILEECGETDYNEVFTAEDGSFYHLMDEDDYSLDSDDGILFLHESPGGSVLVKYTGIPNEIVFETEVPWTSSDTIPLDSLTVSGESWYLLTSPGTFSPMETARNYETGLSLPSEETWKISSYLVPGDDSTDRSKPLEISVEDEYEFVLDSSGYTPGTVKYSYPLAGTGSSGIYGPDRETGEDDQDYYILLQVLTEVSSYQLENPLENSVSVTINGVQTTAFSVSDSGILTFLGYIHPTDRIEVSYRTTSSSDTGGDILFGMGSSFTPLPGLNLEIGTGLRWNMFSGNYTTSMNDSPGSILSSFRASYESDNFNAGFEAGISLSSPDTTGIFRILGMEEGGITFTIPEYGVLPASEPPGLEETDRGQLFFRDYRIYTAMGSSSLQDYDWNIPDDQIYPYTDGSIIGPYTATASSDDKSGNIAVIDYLLEDENSWTGAQIPWADSDGYLDLSSYNSINLSWKWDGEIPEDVSVFIDIGTLKEDLDGDGFLDEETSPYSSGFIFNDQGSGYDLYFGGCGGDYDINGISGNGYTDSEDINGSSFLNPENEEKVLTLEYNPSDSDFPSDVWNFIQIPLTPEMKSKLTGVNSLRIYIVNNGTAPVSGRLLTGDFFLEGSPFINITPESSEGFNTGETWEGHLSTSELPETGLENEYSEVSEIFHSGGESQKIFRVKWDGADAGDEWSDEWEIGTYTSDICLSNYSELSFYMRLPELSSGSENRFYLTYKNSSGSGLEASFTTEQFSEWRKVTVDFVNGSIKCGDSEVQDASVSITSGDYNVSALKIGMTDTDSGLLFLDEFHLSGSRPVFSGGAEGEFSLSIPENILQIGEVPVLSNVEVSGKGFYQGSLFGAGIDYSVDETGSEDSSPNYDAFGGSGSLGGDVLFTGLDLDGSVVYFDDELTWSASHEISLPGSPYTVMFTDRYSETTEGPDKSFSRSDSLSLNPAGFISLDIENSSDFYADDTDEDLLVRDWELVLSLTPIQDLALKASFDIQDSGDVENISVDNYFSQWIKGFSFILPENGPEESSRNGDIDSSIEVSTSPLGGNLSMSTGYSTGTSDGSGYRKTTGEWIFNLNLTGRSSSDNLWVIKPEYGRSYDWTGDDTGETFYEDWQDSFSELEEIDYLYTSVPVYEIFSDSANEEFFSTDFSAFSSRNYTPWYSISLTRSSGSYIRNLFIPSDFSFTQKRQLSEEHSSSEDLLCSDLSLTMNSINLFGTRGVRPVFGDLYETEELQTVITLSREDDLLENEQHSMEFILQNYLYFKLSDLNILSLNNRFSRDFGESEDLSENGTFSWIRNRESLPDFSLFSREFFDEGKLRHSEEIEFTFENEEDGKNGSVLLSHDTSFVLKTGTFSIFSSIGIEHIDNDTEDCWEFGFLAGLEAKFSY